MTETTQEVKMIKKLLFIALSAFYMLPTSCAENTQKRAAQGHRDGVSATHQSFEVTFSVEAPREATPVQKTYLEELRDEAPVIARFMGGIVVFTYLLKNGLITLDGLLGALDGAAKLSGDQVCKYLKKTGDGMLGIGVTGLSYYAFLVLSGLSYGAIKQAWNAQL